jgi:hypothetical protein
VGFELPQPAGPGDCFRQTLPRGRSTRWQRPTLAEHCPVIMPEILHEPPAPSTSSVSWGALPGLCGDRLQQVALVPMGNGVPPTDGISTGSRGGDHAFLVYADGQQGGRCRRGRATEAVQETNATTFDPWDPYVRARRSGGR